MKCQNCGLVNWANATECRRCKISFRILVNEPQAQPSHWQPPQQSYSQPPYQLPQPLQQPYQQPENQQHFYQPPQPYQQAPYSQQPPVYPQPSYQQPQSNQQNSASQPPVYPPQSYQLPPTYQPNAYQQAPLYQPQPWQQYPAAKPKKKSFFSPPESREEALKVIKSSSYYYFFCTAVYLVLAVIMNPYCLIDAIFIGILAGFLLGLKSRAAAISLFLWSILTIISTFFVVASGSPQFNIIGFIIRIIVGITSMQATFAYHGKFNVQPPINYASYTPNNAASYGYSPGYTTPPATNNQQNFTGSAGQITDASNSLQQQ